MKKKKVVQKYFNKLPLKLKKLTKKDLNKFAIPIYKFEDIKI